MRATLVCTALLATVSAYQKCSDVKTTYKQDCCGTPSAYTRISAPAAGDPLTFLPYRSLNTSNPVYNEYWNYIMDLHTRWYRATHEKESSLPGRVVPCTTPTDPFAKGVTTMTANLSGCILVPYDASKTMDENWRDQHLYDRTPIANVKDMFWFTYSDFYVFQATWVSPTDQYAHFDTGDYYSIDPVWVDKTCEVCGTSSNVCTYLTPLKYNSTMSLMYSFVFGTLPYVSSFAVDNTDYRERCGFEIAYDPTTFNQDAVVRVGM